MERRNKLTRSMVNEEKERGKADFIFFSKIRAFCFILVKLTKEKPIELVNFARLWILRTKFKKNRMKYLPIE